MGSGGVLENLGKGEEVEMLKVEIAVGFSVVSKFGLLYRFSRRSLISGGEGVPAIPGYDGYDRSWSCYLSDSKAESHHFSDLSTSCSTLHCGGLAL